MDLLFSPHARWSHSEPQIVSNAAANRSIFTQALRTLDRSGGVGDHFKIAISVDNASNSNPYIGSFAERSILRASSAQSRGQVARWWIGDPGHVRRGSMPTGELLPNGSFKNGTTGWTSSSDYALSAVDRLLRAQRVANTGGALALEQSAAVTVVRYAPYVIRIMVNAGRGVYPGSSFGHRIGTVAAGTQHAAEVATFSYGLQTTCFNAWAGSSVAFSLVDSMTAGLGAGDYLSIPLASLSRCARVDNGPNDLQNAEVFGSSPWVASSGVTGATISANTSTAPDFSSNADSLVENGSTSTHYVSQPVTFSAAAHDRVAWCCIKNNGRNFALLQMDHAGGSVSQYFNVTGGAGAVGSNGATGTGWSDRRAFIVDLGNSWYLCVMVARKSGAQTSGNAYINAASADGTSSYAGSSGNALVLWRGGCAASSEPVRPTGNTSAVSSGTTQTGSGLYTKGWPASTSGLLLPDDRVQIGTQLNILTDRVDSDAAGCAYLQCALPWRVAASDNDAVIVHNPMGRYIQTQPNAGWSDMPGQLSSFQFEFEEAMDA